MKREHARHMKAYVFCSPPDCRKTENWCNLEMIDRIRERNFGKITPIFGFTTISPFKTYNLLFKKLFFRLRNYYKSPFDRLSIPLDSANGFPVL